MKLPNFPPRPAWFSVLRRRFHFYMNYIFLHYRNLFGIFVGKLIEYNDVVNTDSFGALSQHGKVGQENRKY